MTVQRIKCQAELPDLPEVLFTIAADAFDLPAPALLAVGVACWALLS